MQVGHIRNYKDTIPNKVYGHCFYKLLMNVLFPLVVVPRYSNGRYEEIQTNKIPPANKLLTRGWNWIFNGIAACNEIIYETELSPIQFEGKEKIIAEMKILRAFYYYQAISCWGNVPFTTDYTETGYPEQKVVNIFSTIWKKRLMTISSS